LHRTWIAGAAAVSIFLIVAWPSGRPSTSATETTPTGPTLSELQERVSTLEAENRKVQETLADLKELVNRISQDPTAPTRCVTISADTYQEVGKFWQVRGLRLASHPQGVELTGQVLYRLSVNRQNVRLSARLLGAVQDSGDAVIQTIRPGRYSNFSVIIRTRADLRDVSLACLQIDESSGTTGGLY
jgi:hypothetical protein